VGAGFELATQKFPVQAVEADSFYGLDFASTHDAP